MSLILEALRKSEAERQIGRAPGLLTPMPILRPAQRRRRWLGRALLALALLAVALVGAWWLGRNGGPATPIPVDGPTAAAPAPAPAPAATSSAAVPTVAPTPPAGGASSRPAVARDPTPSAGPADLPSDPDFASTERESLPLPPPAPAAAHAPAPAEMPPIAPASAPVPPAPVAAESAVGTPPADEWLPPLRTLTEAERGGLPPLRMSMHVFNADPARRFVLIDGHRRIEGEQLADGVRIERIRRDGAVLDLRGRRVLLERP